MTKIWLNDELVNVADAKVSVRDRGFLFGDGVFETIRLAAGKPYGWESHWQRLTEGANVLQMALPEVQVISQAAAKVIEANALQDALLRIAISRGEGSKGYLPTGEQTTWVIDFRELPEPIENPVQLMISQWRKPSLEALPSYVKLSQGLGSTLAAMEAEAAGAFDAIMLSGDDYVAEASSANLFVVMNGTVMTPTLETGALAGITRAMVMRHMEVEEIDVTPDALEQVEEVFLTNSGYGIIPVGGIDGVTRTWDQHPIAEKLQQLYYDELRHAATG